MPFISKLRPKSHGSPREDCSPDGPQLLHSAPTATLQPPPPVVLASPPAASAIPIPSHPSYSSSTSSLSSPPPLLSSSSSSSHHHHHHHFLSPPQSSLSSLLSRPRLPHMSHSSSAVTTSASSSNHSHHHHSNSSYYGGSPTPDMHNSSSPPIGSYLSTSSYSQNAENHIFGVSLKTSIKYASSNIILTDKAGKEYVYGQIPIIVAKCSHFLKKNATDTEGIFRLSGSARRIKELQAIFSDPPAYGKSLDWKGFTVHDAANVLRRYLNNLPEPIIPLEQYDQFRLPLSKYPVIIEHLQGNQSISATSSGLPNANTTTNLPTPSIETTNTKLSPRQFPAENILPTLKTDLPDSQSTTAKSSSNSGSSASITSQPESVKTEETVSPVTPVSPPKDAATKPHSQQSPTSLSSTPSATSTAPPVVSSKPSAHRSDDANEMLQAETDDAIRLYKILLETLPSLNRQLLLYILDLLAFFASRSQTNLMPAVNLAAIFQPSILSHPNHNMAPQEYHLSRAVVQFLMEHFRALAPLELDPDRAKTSTTTTDPRPRHHYRRHSKSMSSVTVPSAVSSYLKSGKTESTTSVSSSTAVSSNSGGSRAGSSSSLQPQPSGNSTSIAASISNLARRSVSPVQSALTAHLKSSSRSSATERGEPTSAGSSNGMVLPTRALSPTRTTATPDLAPSPSPAQPTGILSALKRASSVSRRKRTSSTSTANEPASSLATTTSTASTAPTSDGDPRSTVLPNQNAISSTSSLTAFPSAMSYGSTSSSAAIITAIDAAVQPIPSTTPSSAGGPPTFSHVSRAKAAPNDDSSAQTIKVPEIITTLSPNEPPGGVDLKFPAVVATTTIPVTPTEASCSTLSSPRLTESSSGSSSDEADEPAARLQSPAKEGPTSSGANVSTVPSANVGDTESTSSRSKFRRHRKRVSQSFSSMSNRLTRRSLSPMNTSSTGSSPRSMASTSGSSLPQTQKSQSQSLDTAIVSMSLDNGSPPAAGGITQWLNIRNRNNSTGSMGGGAIYAQTFSSGSSVNDESECDEESFSNSNVQLPESSGANPTSNTQLGGGSNTSRPGVSLWRRSLLAINIPAGGHTSDDSAPPSAVDSITSGTSASFSRMSPRTSSPPPSLPVTATDSHGATATATPIAILGSSSPQSSGSSHSSRQGWLQRSSPFKSRSRNNSHTKLEDPTAAVPPPTGVAAGTGETSGVAAAKLTQTSPVSTSVNATQTKSNV